MTQKLTVDTFNTQTFDNAPVELLAAVEHDYATIYIPGLVGRAKVCATLPKDKAFELYHNAFVMTYNELRKAADFK